jgi:hypothetical protein
MEAPFVKQALIREQKKTKPTPYIHQDIRASSRHLWAVLSALLEPLHTKYSTRKPGEATNAPGKNQGRRSSLWPSWSRHMSLLFFRTEKGWLSSWEQSK